MSNNRPKLDSLFLAAVEITSAAEQAAFLDESCGEDHELRQQVEQLLQSHEQAGSFLDKPAAKLEPSIVPDVSGNNLAGALQAGLATAFREDESVVVGSAHHSVLKSLGQTVDVPRVVLRDAAEEGDDHVLRPTSPEIPDRDANSRYQLQGEIARGGMGAIIKGRDADLGRDLAVKVLLDGHKDKPEMVQRFIEEAQIGGQLQHPGITPVYELGQFADQRPFFSMKLVRGKTLSVLLDERVDPPDDRVKLLGIFEQVCQTMAYAHSRGVIHRDLKPANVMVGAFGEVQVMDWGLAKVLPAGGVADEKKAHARHADVSIIQTMRSVGSDAPGSVGSAGSETQMGSVMGTPAYMPPEQALGEIDRLDERADVFGLGAILSEILTGKPPYIGADGKEVFRQASRAKLDDCFVRLDNSGSDRELTDLAKRALAAEPEQRLRNASVLAEGVTTYLASVQERLKQAELARAEAKARAEHATRRRKLHIAIAGLMVLFAAGAGISAIEFRRQRGVQTGLASKNMALAIENDNRRIEAEIARAQIGVEKNNVEEQKDRADAKAEELRRRLYASYIVRAVAALEMNRINVVREMLSACPPDLRGWEWNRLHRLTDRSRKTLRGHTDAVQAVAFSPDGKFIVSGSSDQTLKLWDATTGQELKTLHGHAEAVQAVAFSPDGTSIVSGSSDQTLKLWDATTGQELKTLHGHTEAVQAVAFSRAGTSIVSGSLDQTLKLWDATTGQELKTLHGHTDGVQAVAFSPAGTSIVSGSVDRTLMLWDAITGQRLQILKGYDRPVSGVAFSPDGERIVSSSAEEFPKLWDSHTGKELRTFQHHVAWVERASRVRAPECAVAFSPDGRRVGSGSGGTTVWVWNLENDEDLVALRGHRDWVFSIAFNHDGSQIVSGSADHTLKLWDTDTEQDVLTMHHDHGQMRAVTFSPDGRHVASAGFDGTVRIWDTTTGQEVHNLRDHQGWTLAVAYSPDGRLIASGGADTTLRLWAADTGRHLRTLRGHTDMVNHVAFSPDGKRIGSSGYNDNTVRIWDVTSGQEVFTLSGHVGFVEGVAFSPDGRYIASCAMGDKTVKLWDADTGGLLRTLSLSEDDPRGVAFSPDGRHIAAGGGDGTARVWLVETGEEVLMLSGHAQRLTALAFSPDGRRIFSSSLDGTVKVWHAQTGEELLTLQGHESGLWCVAVSTDRRTIAAATSVNAVKLWATTSRADGYESREPADNDRRNVD